LNPKGPIGATVAILDTLHPNATNQSYGLITARQLSVAKTPHVQNSPGEQPRINFDTIDRAANTVKPNKKPLLVLETAGATFFLVARSAHAVG
jgi:hypothetical protein